MELRVIVSRKHQHGFSKWSGFGLIVRVYITNFMIVDLSCDIFTQRTLSILMGFGAN
jgi:hypothetical protein